MVSRSWLISVRGALQFGKGLYFADLVSKSAQYCFVDKKNPVGLLLLSEVALGQMHELKKASVSGHVITVHYWHVFLCLLDIDRTRLFAVHHVLLP